MNNEDFRTYVQERYTQIFNNHEQEEKKLLEEYKITKIKYSEKYMIIILEDGQTYRFWWTGGSVSNCPEHFKNFVAKLMVLDNSLFNRVHTMMSRYGYLHETKKDGWVYINNVLTNDGPNEVAFLESGKVEFTPR